MKICTKCGKEYELKYFNFKNKDKGIRSSECKTCHQKMRKNYYLNNKVKERSRISKRKKEIKDWYITYKHSLKCIRCGEDHPATLQFHHRNPKEKEFDVSVCTRNGYGMDRIKEEIKKCDVLCANCHCKETLKYLYEKI